MIILGLGILALFLVLLSISLLSGRDDTPHSYTNPDGHGESHEDYTYHR